MKFNRMKIEIANIKCILVLCLFLLLCGCEKDNELSVKETPSSGYFALSVKEYQGAATKTGRSFTGFSDIYYYILDQSGAVVPMPYSGIGANMSYIRIENLSSGSYRLIVCAKGSATSADRWTVNKLNYSSQKWFAFSDDMMGALGAEYFYGEQNFTVANGVVSVDAIELSRVVGLVNIKINTTSEFTASGVIKKVELFPDQDCRVYSSFDGNGRLNDARAFADLNLTESMQFLSMPTVDGQVLKGKIAIHSPCLDGNMDVSYYDFSTTIASNTINTINIAYHHPDDTNRLLYVNFRRYNNQNSNYIFSDTEPKSVYYDSKQRSFSAKQPLQLKALADSLLHIRFYSAVGVKNVKIIWRNSGKDLEFARYDSIPPFFEASFSHPLTASSGFLQEANGKMIFCQRIDKLEEVLSSLRIECEDPYWQKIKSIIPDFNIRFAPYGGNPDAPDGAPQGNWMGIRPVHIREACAALTNIAYMISTPDFEKMVTDNAATGVYKNNQSNAISASTIISQYRSNRFFDVGLVWAGNGVIGLGGGTVWGIYQGGYFNHYQNSSTMWHELGHCVGYSHSSTMTYGQFAENHCKNLYLQMCNAGKMPVSYKSILNSDKNPYKY